MGPNETASSLMSTRSHPGSSSVRWSWVRLSACYLVRQIKLLAFTAASSSFHLPPPMLWFGAVCLSCPLAWVFLRENGASPFPGSALRSVPAPERPPRSVCHKGTRLPTVFSPLDLKYRGSHHTMEWLLLAPPPSAPQEALCTGIHGSSASEKAHLPSTLWLS